MRIVEQNFEVVDVGPSRVEGSAKKIEAYGRTCYKSEARITENSADEFVRMAIRRGHHSILEHVSFAFTRVDPLWKRGMHPQTIRFLNETWDGEGTGVLSGNLRSWRELRSKFSGNELFGSVIEFIRAREPVLVEDIPIFMNPVTMIPVTIVTRHHLNVHGTMTVRILTDRGVTHEAVRHRPASYSQESTRYCNYVKGGLRFVRPVDFELTDRDIVFLERVEQVYNNNVALGMKPQQARFFLPNGLAAEIVMTATIDEWRHVFALRTTDACHPQMKALMRMGLQKAVEAVPGAFDDIVVLRSSE